MKVSIVLDTTRVCSQLKKDEKYAKIPIVLFTARAQNSDKKMGMDSGADAYVTKPFEPQVLLKKIDELLKG